MVGLEGLVVEGDAGFNEVESSPEEKGTVLGAGRRKLSGGVAVSLGDAVGEPLMEFGDRFGISGVIPPEVRVGG